MWHELPSQLVELRHVGDRAALLSRDLLGAVLVDHVVVGDRQGLAVVEVDLVLAEVALALRVLDRHPGGRHLVADPSQQRLDPRTAEHRVVVVVEVGRLEVPVALVPGVLVGVPETMNSSSVPAFATRPRSSSRASWRRRICRGDAMTSVAVGPGQIRHQEHRPGVPGDGPQRVQVGLHLEVPVAPLPRRHRVARDGVHLDVNCQQVVAALGAVLEHHVEEVRRGQALALETPLHVRDHEHHGVDGAVRRPPF